MTREEAIKELQESHDTLRDYDIDNSSRLKQALSMAIIALEQNPGEWVEKLTAECERLNNAISQIKTEIEAEAHAVLQESRMYDNFYLGKNMGLNDALDIIDSYFPEEKGEDDGKK